MSASHLMPPPKDQTGQFNRNSARLTTKHQLEKPKWSDVAGDSEMEVLMARRARAVFYAFLACLLGFGITLICLGSKNMSAIDEYSLWVRSSEESAPILALISGCFILALIVLGFVSAFKELKPGLLAFAGILSIVTVIEIVGGALAANGSARSTSSLQHKMEESMPQYLSQETIKQTWDKLQINMECCGSLDSKQWKDVTASKGPPSSCCGKRINEPAETGSKLTTKPSVNQQFCLPKEKVFRQGCYRPLSAYIKTSMDEIAYVCLIFSFFQIFIIALAVYLAFAIKRERDVKVAVLEVFKEGSESALSRRTEAERAISTISPAVS